MCIFSGSFTHSIHLPILPLGHIAVPIFFIISGYFIYGKSNKLDPNKLRRTAIKIAKLIIVSQSIYIIYTLATSFRHEGRLDTLLSSIGWFYTIFFGSWFSGPLWYLTAFLETILFIWLIVRLRAERILPYLIPVCLLARCLMKFYYSHYPTAPYFSWIGYNLITDGIPCVIIGMMIRRFLHLAPSQRILCFITALLFITLYLSGYTFDIYSTCIHQISIFLLATSAFILVIRYEPKHRLTLICAKYGKDNSRDIYIGHSLMGVIVRNLVPDFISIINPIATFAITLLGSKIYNYIKQTRPINLNLLPKRMKQY